VSGPESGPAEQRPPADEVDLTNANHDTVRVPFGNDGPDRDDTLSALDDADGNPAR
jgi:hypothetical protein